MWAPLCLLLLAVSAGAKTLFHDVNDFDLNGKACSVAKSSYACATLCVSDHKYCPGSSGECPGNATLCVDGTCADKCKKDLKNPCTCSTKAKDESSKQKACAIKSGEYDAALMEEEALCGSLYNQTLGTLNTTLQVFTATSLGPDVLKCNAKPHPSGTESGFLALFIGWGVFAALNLLWLVVRNKEKSDPHAHQTIKGFRNHILGTILFGLYIVLSFSFVAIYAFTLNEYYFTFAAFFGDSFDQLAVCLIFTWHLAVIWYVFSKMVSPFLRNYYRYQVPMADAVFVEIWNKDDPLILLEDDSNVTVFIRWVMAKGKQVFGEQGNASTYKIQATSQKQKYFDHHCARFTFDENLMTYQSVSLSIPETHMELLEAKTGLSSDTASKYQELAGENIIRVQVPNIVAAFVIEFTSYFYIYQFMALWVYFYWDYWNMGLIFLSVIFVSGVIKVILKRISELKIKSMAEKLTTCTVLRDGNWKELSSEKLVPLDVIKVERDMVVPCDAVILSNSCVVDESMLTGESMPIQKFPLSEDNVAFNKMSYDKKSSIFAGSVVLDTQGSGECIALAVDVAAHTEKGHLVSGILYAGKVSFMFDEHLTLVIGILVLWMVVAIPIICVIYGATGTTVWLYAIFIISQVLPPLLPAVLVIGQSVAANRLRQQDIFAVDLHRITIAGKVKTFCFDKTGTLTTEGLRFHGLLPANDAAFSSEIVRENLPSLLQQAIGCAHTITKLNLDGKGEQFVGNPVDVEMFKVSGWTMEDSGSGAVYCRDGQTIKLLKQHSFDHNRMSMAVVVQINDEVHVFVKGSFEAIKKISTTESLPTDYFKKASGLAADGNYTLGIGHRCLGKIDPEEAKALPRDQVEQGNNFVALMCFRNELKPDTTEAITALRNGGVRPVMITGDTALTGLFIGRKCGILNDKICTILGEIDPEAKSPTVDSIIWTEIDNISREKKGVVKLPIPTVGDSDSERTPLKSGSDNVELAMNGAVFRILVQEGTIIRKILPSCQVFARMTPTDKTDCVRLFMEKETTAMCGDGGNDCGALRAAHVGIAMSDGEASIVSPFSTKNHSVWSCVTLLREGRCALSTSFFTYEFMLTYGETIVWSKFFYLYYGAQLSEWVWILFEGIIVPVFCFSLAQSRPADTLAPRRPTARLLGIETISSVTGIVILNFLFMILSIALLSVQEFYVCNEWDSSKEDLRKWQLLADNYEGQTVGLLVMNCVLSVGAAANFSASYRKPWCYNFLFVFAYCVFFGIVSAIILLDPNELGCWFRFNCGDPDVLAAPPLNYKYAANVSWTGAPYNSKIGHNVYPVYFRWYLWYLCVANLIVVCGFMRFGILGPVRNFCRRKYGKKVIAN